MSAIAPYRSPGELAPTKPRDTFGLLRASKFKPHKCNPPGWLVRTVYLLVCFPIHPGSLFRCTCHNVFRFGQRAGDVMLSWIELTNHNGNDAWKRLGGDIVEKESDT